MQDFDPQALSDIFVPEKNSNGEDNGQITIIGGSTLFHGAPILSLKVASRFVDMVFFASPEKSVGRVADKIKSTLSSFIWVPWEEVEQYVKKSDAILIGPGFMRFSSENDGEHFRVAGCDDVCQKTKEITKGFLEKFPEKRWVIDGGSLQVMDKDWIPEGAILTPNKKEYNMLFEGMDLSQAAEKYLCTIVLKGPETFVASSGVITKVLGGNPGMTKGGTGDVLAGLTVALYAKNDAHLAATAASFIQKKAADILFDEVGVGYNADDLAEKIPHVYFESVYKNNYLH